MKVDLLSSTDVCLLSEQKNYYIIALHCCDTLKNKNLTNIFKY